MLILGYEHFAPLELGLYLLRASINIPSLRDWSYVLTNLTRKKNMNPRLAGRPQACYFGTSNHSVASGGNETIAEYCWPCRGISSATRLSI